MKTTKTNKILKNAVLVTMLGTSLLLTGCGGGGVSVDKLPETPADTPVTNPLPPVTNPLPPVTNPLPPAQAPAPVADPADILSAWSHEPSVDLIQNASTDIRWTEDAGTSTGGGEYDAYDSNGYAEVLWNTVSADDAWIETIDQERTVSVAVHAHLRHFTETRTRTWTKVGEWDLPGYQTEQTRNASYLADVWNRDTVETQTVANPNYVADKVDGHKAFVMQHELTNLRVEDMVGTTTTSTQSQTGYDSDETVQFVTETTVVTTTTVYADTSITELFRADVQINVREDSPALVAIEENRTRTEVKTSDISSTSTTQQVTNPNFMGLELDAGSVDMTEVLENDHLVVFGENLVEFSTDKTRSGVAATLSSLLEESINPGVFSGNYSSNRDWVLSRVAPVIGGVWVEDDILFDEEGSSLNGSRAEEARSLILQNMFDAKAVNAWATHDVTGAGINVRMVGFTSASTGQMNFDEYTTLMTAASIAPDATFAHFMVESDITIANGTNGTGTTLYFNRSGSVTDDFDNTLFDVGTAAGIGALVMEKFPTASNKEVNGNVERSGGNALEAISPTL